MYVCMYVCMYLCLNVCITFCMYVKERLAALWRDFLRVFFNIPTHYLYSHTANLPTAHTFGSFSQHIQSQVLQSEDGNPNLAAPESTLEDGIQNINAILAK